MFTIISTAFSFLTGGSIFGNIAKYVLLIGGVLLAAFIWLSAHDAAIRKSDLAQYNATQQQIIEKQQKIWEAELQKITDLELKLTADLASQNEEVQHKVDSITTALNKVPTNVPGAIIKEVLKQLQEQFGSTKKHTRISVIGK